MIRLAAAILVSVATVSGSAAAQKKPPKGGADGNAAPAAVVEGERGAKLDRAVAGFDTAGGGFCGTVLVAAGGKVLLEKGYGLADEAAGRPLGTDALWDWASVSKQFTAAAVLRLQDQKKLKLDDPISKWFKDAPKDKAGVTLRQILNHTSGIESGFKQEWKFDGGKRESFEKLVLGLPMTAKPGEAWEYSNSGYAFAAAIVERVTGKAFEEWCEEQLFKPAGMKDATFIGRPGLALARVPKIERGKGFTDRPRDFAFAYGNTLSWGYRGCGGTVATARDLFAWDRALRGDKLLSKVAREAFYQPALNDYALGWTVRKSRDGVRVEHSGGVLGVVTNYLRLLDEDIVVALACSYQPKDHPSRLAEELVAIARAKD